MSNTTMRAYNGEARLATAVIKKDGKIFQTYPEKKTFESCVKWFEHVQDSNPSVKVDMRFSLALKKQEDTPEQAQVRALYKKFHLESNITYFKADAEYKARYPHDKIYMVDGVESIPCMGNRRTNTRLYVIHEGRPCNVYFNRKTGLIKTHDSEAHTWYEGLPPSGKFRIFKVIEYGRPTNYEASVIQKMYMRNVSASA